MMKFKSTFGRSSVSCHTVEWVHRHFFCRRRVMRVLHRPNPPDSPSFFLFTRSWRRLRLFVLSSAFKRKLSLWNKFKSQNVQTRRFFIDLTTNIPQGSPDARNFPAEVSGIAQEMEKNDNKTTKFLMKLLGNSFLFASEKVSSGCVWCVG